MQPCSREMQSLNSLFNNQQQIQMDPATSQEDDFIKQMLSTIPPPPPPSWNLDHTPPNPKPYWLDNDNVAFPNYDDPSTLASKFRNHQITANSSSKAAAAALLLQQQLLMTRGLSGADSAILHHMFDSSQNDVVDASSSSFKSPNPTSADGSVQALYDGFTGSLQGAALASNQTHHFQHPQVQTSSNPNQMQGQGQGTSQGGNPNPNPNPGQPKQRVRARRGQATDPHSIAERLRRERIAERMKALQELVPNANKTDKASMLDEIIDYVKFLQLQVKVLSMSRLGGAAAVAPLVADINSEGGGDCVQTNGNQTAGASSSNDSLTMTEQQVAKLMEEDMGSAMQYLQGKGLCLMPISLATAISTATATCHPRNPIMNPTDGPSSPGMSVLTVQSANGDAVKDATSVSKP
ncbi:hypothetical protein HN51_064151 [Arachis hypogaea]|uniref:BHLH domain-containing protein n=1 Tax=Arachis hypogaea TaxID=3818 RepID=A0A445AVG4_ARAHY|nr:transcription factor bHLH82 [Arachis ipaensis]XP_025630583.1 transcription factor bHLH82 [Arachis hypogaea]QHO21751.1 Transcription factor [Arachis hypogaea]RYR30435.1 hypothetical protein Ahy_B01g055206 isoform B [Arachis hypogaea]